MIANRDSIEESERFSRQEPSERDLQVYAAVRVDGRRQVDVAAELGISQGRVSQIVRRVNQWRVGLGIDAELERRDRKSIDRWLEQLRIEKLYEETMELFRRSQQPRRKERRGKDHRGEWSTETLDHQPGNLQCLKLAARLIELKRQLDEDPPRPDQSMDSPRSRIDEYEAFRFLVDLRSDAVRRGDVPEGDISEYVVQRMMRELVGSACRAEPDGAQTVDEPATSSEGSSRQEEPTEPANISDISADAPTDEAAGEAAPLAATACVAETSDGSAKSEPSCADADAGANNSPFFSSDVPADWLPEPDPTGELSPGQRGLVTAGSS